MYRAHTGWAQLGIPLFCSSQSLASYHCPLCAVVPGFVEPQCRTSREKSLVPGHRGDVLVQSICPFALFSIPSSDQLHFQPRSSSPHIHHRGPLTSRNKLLRVVLLLRRTLREGRKSRNNTPNHEDQADNRPNDAPALA
jgi:hypothetical protein